MQKSLLQNKDNKCTIFKAYDKAAWNIIWINRIDKENWFGLVHWRTLLNDYYFKN